MITPLITEGREGVKEMESLVILQKETLLMEVFLSCHHIMQNIFS
mgnify:CR=1 FL=1